MDDPKTLDYQTVRELIRDVDVLLFRRRKDANVVSVGISRLGRSEYTHVAMAAWWHERLWCIETNQRYGGGRVVLLSSVVARHPGLIEVYRSRRATAMRRFKILGAMLAVAGQPYGWRQFFTMAFKAMPFVRWFLPANTDDHSNGSRPVCSAAVGRAFRAGEIDLVPNLADSETTPGDIGRSAELQKLYRIGDLK